MFSPDISIDDLISGMNRENILDLSPFLPDLLEEYSNGLYGIEDFEGVVNPVPHSSTTTEQSPPGLSPESNSHSHESSNGLSEAVALPDNMHFNSSRLLIVAQPYYGMKLRYRSDYENNENRLGALKNRTKNSSYQGPAIRIPQCYLNLNGGYFIRVSLVTIEYDQTKLHYLHPYELEHPTNEELNDRLNNAVWFAIQAEDCNTGIKSFPALRIVKKRATDLKTYGNLRMFDCQNTDLQNHSLSQLSSAKDTISTYHLDHSQLAFTVVGGNIIDNKPVLTHIDPSSTVFSDVMIEGIGNEGEMENDISPGNERPATSPAVCRVYKYAPKYGFDGSEEDMIIFLTHKLEAKKYGELYVTFECKISDGQWSQPITDLDIKDRVVSFKTPMFPHAVDMVQGVDVVLRQENRIIGTIKYYYLETLANCSRCQLYTIQKEINVVPNVSRKRGPNILEQMPADETDDAMVPIAENPVKLEQPSKPPPSSLSAGNRSNSLSSPTIQSRSLPATTDPNEQLLDKLSSSIKAIFLNNDYDLFFRLCRTSLKKSPQLLHNAIEQNYLDLLLKFIPTAQNSILQQKNEIGETALLHAVRLERIEIIQALLKKEKSEVLLENIDGKDNNIFHIIALNSYSLQIIELFVDHLLKNSNVNRQKFDRLNEDYWTPLQLAIYKNNLPVVKVFLQYFRIDIHEIKNLTGDNLLHLAVRYGDLVMIKYLIEDGQLVDQGEQSNLKMTPGELAESFHRDDMAEYFKEIYPPKEIEEDDSSGDDG